MEPSRWQQIREIFAAAAALEPAERPAFVAAQCGSDAELRREVESLLAAAVSDALRSGQAVAELAPELRDASERRHLPVRSPCRRPGGPLPAAGADRPGAAWAMVFAGRARRWAVPADRRDQAAARRLSTDSRVGVERFRTERDDPGASGALPTSRACSTAESPSKACLIWSWSTCAASRSPRSATRKRLTVAQRVLLFLAGLPARSSTRTRTWWCTATSSRRTSW